MAEPTGRDGDFYTRGRDRRNRRDRSSDEDGRRSLNLGMPFIEVDDYVNQSEDAITTGYRVLIDTVDQIKEGYEEAKRFHEKQEAWEKGDKTQLPPDVPWEDIVNRAQNMQDIAFDAVRAGTDIFIGAMRSGSKSARGAAKTWSGARKDTAAKPKLAGPVFEGGIEVTVPRGGTESAQRPKRHVGLARLRIAPTLDSSPKLVNPTVPGTAGSVLAAEIDLTFEPPASGSPADTTILTATVTDVDPAQVTGTYEAQITASNFELYIGTLYVEVTE